MIQCLNALPAAAIFLWVCNLVRDRSVSGGEEQVRAEAQDHDEDAVYGERERELSQ